MWPSPRPSTTGRSRWAASAARSASPARTSRYTSSDTMPSGPEPDGSASAVEVAVSAESNAGSASAVGPAPASRSHVVASGADTAPAGDRASVGAASRTSAGEEGATAGSAGGEDATAGSAGGEGAAARSAGPAGSPIAAPDTPGRRRPTRRSSDAPRPSRCAARRPPESRHRCSAATTRSAGTVVRVEETTASRSVTRRPSRIGTSSTPRAPRSLSASVARMPDRVRCRRCSTTTARRRARPAPARGTGGSTARPGPAARPLPHRRVRQPPHAPGLEAHEVRPPLRAPPAATDSGPVADTTAGVSRLSSCRRTARLRPVGRVAEARPRAARRTRAPARGSAC